MALLFVDSFDHYATADVPVKWQTLGSGPATIAAAGGRRGGNALNLSSTLGAAVTLPASGATGIVGCAIKFSTFTLQGNVFVLANGPTMQVNLHINTDGTLGIGRGGDIAFAPTTVLGTSTAALSLNVYYYLEVKWTISDTVGAATVRLNEDPILTLSGLDTNNGSTNAWTQFRTGARGTALQFVIDDLYILDGSGSTPLNNFLGDCRVDARYPTAAGATTGWTPSTGANWAAVDDATPNGDTDYVSAAASGPTDTYTVQDAPVPGALLYGVQHVLSIKKSDAGTCSVVPVIRHSGVDYPGTAANPGTGYAFQMTPYPTNPGTGAAWTEADFNAAEFGVKRTA